MIWINHRSHCLYCFVFLCSIDATDTTKATYLSVRKYINACESMEMALLPIMTNLIAVALGPKQYMAVSCFATKEEVKHRGPSYHTDLAIHKMQDQNSSYIRVATGASNIIMIIELKVNVPTTVPSVPLKDILELLIYLIYVMEDNGIKTMCGVLSDTKTFHCFKVQLENEKIKILDYIKHYSEDEVTHLGFLVSLVDQLQLD